MFIYTFQELGLQQDLNNSIKKNLRINVFLWKVNAYTHSKENNLYNEEIAHKAETSLLTTY